MSIEIFPWLLLLIGGICGCVPRLPPLAFPICVAVAGGIGLALRL